MYNYWIFAGLTYYPEGGFRDFSKAFGSIDAAVNYAQTLYLRGIDWWHIVDISTMQIVKEGG